MKIPPPVTGPAPMPARIVSVDVYRGFVMLLMMAEVLRLSTVADALPGNAFWQFLGWNQSHVPWTGGSLHDMIQPSFSFLVGVALPFSIASRTAKGATFNSLLKHTLVRSLILVLLGIFLRSLHSTQTNFTFEDTLTQIGLGYPFLFLLGFATRRTQVVTVLLILAGYWLAFVLYPLPATGFDTTLVGVPADWPHNMQGLAAHWNKNTNLAAAFDQWFLNLFPREKPFAYNRGGYVTLSFIPTLGTMALGLFAGRALKSTDTPQERIRFFLITGACLLAAAALLHFTGICPIVKRIWTPSWTLFSGGLCFFFLTFFYWLTDVAGRQKYILPLVVIGMNSIAAYVIADGFGGFISNSLSIHLGQNFDQVLGSAYAPLVRGIPVLAMEWLILYWMYRKKIFIKV
ncbi:acyltransferase family protein [Chitinophaga alhagiae]|nr:DUF5009 domain-containing protein [Chitinophaga alhagiae]